MEASLLPAVLNESDVYREVPPPAWAAGAIACFWMRRGDGRPVRVIPDGSTDIVWRQGAGATVAGPDTGAWVTPTTPGGLIVGARFRAGAGGALGVPLAEVRDLRIPLDALGLELHAELEEAAAPSAVARLALRLVADAPPDRAVQEAARRLRDPGRRIEEIAAALGLSERQLRRRFLATVGYGPKTLQRILRMRSFLKLGEADDLAGSAAAAGYADQAHLNREVRALTGLTPGEILIPQRAIRKTAKATTRTPPATSHARA
jgi:AraC-like DNA-binding protein